jgi:Zn-finger nucleic acid-binding protein
MAYRELPPVGCAVCGAGMEEAEIRGEPVLRCPRCGGWWMAREALATIVHQVYGKPIELLEFPDGSPVKACPVCSDDMQIVWIELLSLDQCPRHGVWLDRGELGRLLQRDVVPAKKR